MVKQKCYSQVPTMLYLRLSSHSEPPLARWMQASQPVIAFFTSSNSEMSPMIEMMFEP